VESIQNSGGLTGPGCRGEDRGRRAGARAGAASPTRRGQLLRTLQCARADMMHFMPASMPMTMGRAQMPVQSQQAQAAKRSSWSPSVSNDTKENQAGTVPGAAPTRPARARSARAAALARGQGAHVSASTQLKDEASRQASESSLWRRRTRPGSSV
jgi:hypothetical protein